MPVKDDEFVPIPPGGFDIAGTFDGVTTAVGQGGTPRIRYEIIDPVNAPSAQSEPESSAVARVMTSAGWLEIQVSECHSEAECRQLLRAALAPYRRPG